VSGAVAKVRHMGRRVLPVALVLAAGLADVRELHALAFYLLVAAVPATAVSALAFFGDLVETPGGAAHVTYARLQVVLTTLGLVLIVVAAAVRGQAALEAGVPAVSVSALVACLLVFASQGLVGLTSLALEGKLVRRVLRQVDQRLHREEGPDRDREARDDGRLEEALARR